MSTEKIMGAFDEALSKLMPRNVAADYRVVAQEQEKRLAALRLLMQKEVCEAITYLASVIQYPLGPRADMRRAQQHVQRALEAALQLDPEETP